MHWWETCCIVTMGDNYGKEITARSYRRFFFYTARNNYLLDYFTDKRWTASQLHGIRDHFANREGVSTSTCRVGPSSPCYPPTGVKCRVRCDRYLQVTASFFLSFFFPSDCLIFSWNNARLPFIVSWLICVKRGFSSYPSVVCWWSGGVVWYSLQD